MKNLRKNKPFWRFTLVLAVSLAFTVILCTLMVKKSNQTINQETQRYLYEISDQAAAMVRQRIDYNIRALEDAGENISFFKDQPDLRAAYLKKMADRYSFFWVGTADSDGLMAAPGGNVLDMKGYRVVQSALDGQASVSEELAAPLDGMEGLLYAVPIFDREQVNGAVIGCMGPESMQTLLSVDTFSGQGFSHIINQNGDFLLRSANKNSVIQGDNFFEALDKNGRIHSCGDVSEMKSAMKRGESGNLSFTIDQAMSESMNYIPLNGGDWYLLSIVPSSIYEGKVWAFTRFALITNVIISLIFLGVIVYVAYVYRKKNLQIMKTAYEDPVTGGFTSARFKEVFSEKFQNFHPFTFVSLDIRRFKLINDEFGSFDGNRVLKYVHDVFSKNLRDGEAVSRIDSDTFNVILDTEDPAEASARLKQISEQINEFNSRMSIPYFLPLDCGLYTVADKDQDLITVRDRANSARKNTKGEGGQSLCECVFYDDMARLLLLREKEIENNMERALKDGEFVVYLQPKVELKHNHIIGAEALVRWVDPQRGIIPPAEFIPFFEKNGFILKMDMYVFEQVCRLLRKWIDSGRTPYPISVNLSRVHLREPGFLMKYKEIQERYQVPPHLLEIELTETLVFENLKYLKKVVSQIHEFGFHCSMDDFGSGYSSLNVLKEVPVDTLKLDRAFFDQNGGKRGNDVVESVVNLAKKLGMSTVSEGVETMPQVEFLREIDCDIVQGYVFSKPVQIEVFEKMSFENGG